jgi:hypothetical protein
VNQNQGAESTLAFLLALTEMQLLENSLATFRQATEAGEREVEPHEQPAHAR